MISRSFANRFICTAVTLVLVGCRSDKTLDQPVVGTSKALLGGFEDTGSDVPLAFLVDTNNLVQRLSFPDSPEGEIKSVAISEDGTKGMLGGSSNTGGTAFAYYADLQQSPPTLTSLPIGTTGQIFSTAISADGRRALIGGDEDTSGPTTAVLLAVDLENSPIVNNVAPFTSMTELGQIFSVALSENGEKGLVGGTDFSVSAEPKAYSFDWTGSTPIATQITLHTDGEVHSVAINASGTRGLIGGTDGLSDEMVVYQVEGTSATAITLSDAGTDKVFLEVAINRSGSIGIVGGHNSSEGLGYILNLSDTPTLSTNTKIAGLLSDSQINSVAIDSLGNTGLLGGETGTGEPLAYVVDVSSKSIRATLNNLIHASGNIQSVEIQDLGGAGIIGGSDTNTNLPIAFLLTNLSSSSPTVTQLDLGSTGTGSIFSVSFDQLLNQLNQIPLNRLSGNNLSLAEYLNKNAPSLAAYFIPESNNASALEIVSPLRNAATLFSADNAFFSISQGLSLRSRDIRQFRRFREKKQKEFAMLTSKGEDLCTVTNCPCEIRLNDLWGEVIGLVARQDMQDETIGFDPTSIALLLSYDAQKTTNFRGGIGLAYAYTYVNYDKRVGSANINQEYITIYGLWNRHGVYADIACWFGLFQTNQERNIPLTISNYQATSFTNGAQFDPHIELGVNYDYCDDTQTIEPFVGVDWIHNWQSAYQEHSDPFNYSQQNLHSSMLRAEAGLRFYQELGFSRWNLVLQESLSYIYKDTYSLGNFKGFLIGAPGTLILNTFTKSQDFGSLGFTMLFDPREPKYPSGRIGYKGEFGSDYRSHQVNLSCEWSF